MSSNLSNDDAKALLAMRKIASSSNVTYAFPDFGGRVSVPLQSEDGRETFSLDIKRKRIVLYSTFQTRARESIVLARLDFGAKHQNPDGKIIGAPHIHIYKEGYADKFAYEVPEGMLKDPDDAWQSLLDFLDYCNIAELPNIKRGLFSK